MLKQISIRPLQTSDYKAVKKIDESTQFQYLGKKWKSLNKSEKEKHLVSRNTEFQINVDTGYGFVALLNDKVIGFIFAFETLPFKGALYIRHVAIYPEYQGKGIGVLLFNALIKKAKTSKIKYINSLINPDNPKSMKLHEKVGFALRDRKEAVLDLEQ